MNRHAQSLSDLQTQRDALSIKILCERFGNLDRPLPYLVAIVAGELIRGSIGSQIPRDLRHKSFVWFQVRKFQEAHNRAPSFLEILALVA